MSNGVRFVGKDPDGIAKAISVNDDGVLLVELLGSLLVGEVVENPTANTILGRMKSLESKIDTLDVVIDSILAKIIAAPATEAKQTALNALIGEVQPAPTANTLLARLKSLEDKLAETLTVQLSGSKMELYGATINDRPAANAVPVGATFMIVGTDSIWQSNGTDWVVM